MRMRISCPWKYCPALAGSAGPVPPMHVHAQSLYKHMVTSIWLQAYGQHYVGPRIFNQKSYERLATQCLPLLTSSGVPLTIKGLHYLQSNRLVVNAKKARKILKQVSEYS